jgi:hypothetical protein
MGNEHPKKTESIASTQFLPFSGKTAAIAALLAWKEFWPKRKVLDDRSEKDWNTHPEPCFVQRDNARANESTLVTYDTAEWGIFQGYSIVYWHVSP